MKMNCFGQFVSGTAPLLLMALTAYTAKAQLGAGYIRIDVPAATSTTAFGINNEGKIVGTYYDSTGLGHGFLRNDDGRYCVGGREGRKTASAVLDEQWHQ